MPRLTGRRKRNPRGRRLQREKRRRRRRSRTGRASWCSSLRIVSRNSRTLWWLAHGAGGLNWQRQAADLHDSTPWRARPPLLEAVMTASVSVCVGAQGQARRRCVLSTILLASRTFLGRTAQLAPAVRTSTGGQADLMADLQPQAPTVQSARNFAPMKWPWRGPSGLFFPPTQGTISLSSRPVSTSRTS